MFFFPMKIKNNFVFTTQFFFWIKIAQKKLRSLKGFQFQNFTLWLGSHQKQEGNELRLK